MRLSQILEGAIGMPLDIKIHVSRSPRDPIHTRSDDTPDVQRRQGRANPPVFLMEAQAQGFGDSDQPQAATSRGAVLRSGPSERGPNASEGPKAR